MDKIKYPPLIESKIPAFVIDDDINEVSISIPYTLNKAVSLNEFSEMAIMIKTVTTGAIKLNTTTAACQLLDEQSQRLHATFIFNKDSEGDKEPEKTFTPIKGNYYKIQIAFKNEAGQSPWSSVGIAKCTATPVLTISSLKPGIDNLDQALYIGTYQNTDVTEKIYSYKFTIFDRNNNIYETSGDLIHNSSTDEIISDIGVQSTLQWKPNKSLQEGERYKIGLTITTINGYIQDSMVYYLKVADTVDAKIPAKLLATPDYDNGRVILSLIKPQEDDHETAFTGNFVITRYSENLNTWNPVCKFNMLSQTPSDAGVLWIDYTIEHGVRYLYAIQAYNSKGLYSNRAYHVLANPDVYSKKKYVEFDEFGNPYYITGDFEDMFLTDGERQLRIKFDPKVSSYKPTILESKTETIGSKYPFIFRNGTVSYKEFPISGLLSYLTDDDELFIKGIKPPEDTMTRSRTAAAAGSETKKDWLNAPHSGSRLTSDNFYRERQFKMAALEWLSNGQPKLFRSPGEGSYIVRLMNTSLSPNDTLGRMLHNFSTTAYEIAEYNFDNLSQHNLLYLPDIDNRVMKFTEVRLAEVSVDNTYTPATSMYHAYITNATPGTKYSLSFNSQTRNASITCVIGLTGSYYISTEAAPLSSIKLIEGDYAQTATLHYGYYDTSVPDNFSYISNITTYDVSNQVIGYDDTKNIITDKLEDLRRNVGHFYSITISQRPIIEIYKNNNQYYYNSLLTELVNQWSELSIYYVVNDQEYFSGNPQYEMSLGKKMPDQYFKFNDTYILDLSTGNAYMSGDPMTDVLKPNPAAQNKFQSYTKGVYQIVGDFKDIHSMHLSTGVYVDLAYELKEIEYSVEATHENVIMAKAAWQEAERNYIENSTYENKILKDTAYSNYLTVLQEAIIEAEEENGYYAI